MSMANILTLAIGVLAYVVLWAFTLGAFRPMSVERSGIYILCTGLGAGLVFGAHRFVGEGPVLSSLGLMLAESAYLALTLFLRSVRLQLSRRSEVRGSVIVLVLTMVHLTLNLNLQGLLQYLVMAVQILVLFSLATREAVLLYRSQPGGITRMLVILLVLHLTLETLGRGYMGYQFFVYPSGTGNEWLQVRDSWTWITFSLGYVVLTATASVLMDAYRSDKFRLEQLVHKVEGRLKERETALMSMLVAHAERDKDPVVASLAHELRQPLHSIRLNAEYLSSGKTVSRQEEADILRSILDENRRAADLLQGLRNIFVNKVPESLAAINLSQWLTDWVQAKAPVLLRDHGIALQLHAQSDVHVHVHAAQVEVIVQNLVTNAVQALHGQPRGSIHLSLVAQQPWACLDVVDNGPGLPEGWSEKVYDMGVSTKADGMGMGLWLSRRIAETHGGTLSSQPSTSGAHMRLHLPLLGIGSK